MQPIDTHTEKLLGSNMTVLTLADDLNPWLDLLSNEDKHFFIAVFDELSKSGFELETPSAREWYQSMGRD